VKTGPLKSMGCLCLVFEMKRLDFSPFRFRLKKGEITFSLYFKQEHQDDESKPYTEALCSLHRLSLFCQHSVLQVQSKLLQEQRNA